MPILTGVVSDFNLSPTAFTLQTGGETAKTREFFFPQSIVLETSPAAGGALAWNVRGGNPGTVTYEVRLNGQTLATYEVGSSDWQTVRETFEVSLLKAGVPLPKVEFRLTGGTAPLSVSDVAVWYRRRLFDPHLVPEAVVFERVGDFLVIKDKSFDLQAAGPSEAEKEFTLAPFPMAESPWLLAWNVRTETAGQVLYEVRVNGAAVTTQTVQGRDWHQVQEVLSSAVFHEGSNQITFRVLSGTTRMSVGDVTVFFKNRLHYSGHTAA